MSGIRYLDMMTVPKLDGIDVSNVWFHYDSATCHTVRETIQLMHESFVGRVVSCFGNQNWSLNRVI